MIFMPAIAICIITLTHSTILSIKSELRCASLIGNPVGIGSGPAAVTPVLHWKV
jgi:hypothetical protein